MQGSLDDPPIVIRSDPLKVGAVFVLCIFVVPCLVLFGMSARGYPWPGWILIAVFVLAGCVFGWMLVVPERLIAGPGGLECRRLWNTQRYAWSDLGEFQPFQGARGITSITAPLGPPPRTRQISLMVYWELGPRELCGLLNAARSRWGG